MRTEERVQFCKYCVQKQHACPGDDYATNKAAPFRFVPYVGLPVRFCTNKYKPQACKGMLGVVSSASLASPPEDPASYPRSPSPAATHAARNIWTVSVRLEGEHDPVEVKAGPAFLPFELRPSFAITVHDAQGGEFDEVHVILPPSEKSPLCCLEMLYTAVSRARQELCVWSLRLPFEAFEGPLARVSRARVSPLVELLRK